MPPYTRQTDQTGPGADRRGSETLLPWFVDYCKESAADGPVEAWARADTNPVGGCYGLRKGYRGRFANYVPPVLEGLGRAEVEHKPRNNRMRAV